MEDNQDTNDQASPSGDSDASRDASSVLNRTMINLETPENTSSQPALACATRPKQSTTRRPPTTKELLQQQAESINGLRTMFEQVLKVFQESIVTNRGRQVPQGIPSEDRSNVGSLDPTGNVANQLPNSNAATGENQPVADDLESLPSGNSSLSSSPSPSPDSERSKSSAKSHRYSPKIYRNLMEDPPEPNFTVINQIPPPTFNGDRAQARAWLRKYEDIMEINGYNDDQKRKRAGAYMKDEASQWLATRLYIDRDLDWWTLKSAFLRHFCGADERTLLRRKLDEAKQKPNEHPSSYLVRIVDLCKEFKPDMSDAEMVSKIASGLNTNTYNILASTLPKDRWSTKWLITMFERFKFTNDRVSRETDTKRRKTSSTPKDLSTWKCFNCGNTGHVVEDCPQPRDETKLKARLDEHRREKSKKKQEGESSNGQRAIQALQDAQPNSLGAQTQAPPLASDNVPKPMLTLRLNGKSITGRSDSGSDITVLPGNVAAELELKLEPWTLPPPKAVGNEPVHFKGMSTVLATYGNAYRAILVAVMPDGTLAQPLWGNDLLNAFEIQINFGKPKPNANVGIVCPPAVLNVETAPIHPIDKVKIGETDSESKDQIHGMLAKYGDVFSRDERDIGRTSTIKHRIILTDDTPVHKNYYRVHARLKDKLQEAIDRQLATGAFRESKSPYASPAFFVKKEGGDLRLVADYRALNAKTVPDRNPMPHPENVFSLLAGSKVYAKLDITSMFNQIEVEEEDIPKTAVITEKGLFECPLMSFGLVNAPATAVRLMREVLRGLDGKTCVVYFDDIIVFASDTQQLVQRCTNILERMRLHNLKLKPSKCEFAMESVKFLGHIISAKGVQMDPKRIEQVLNFPRPRNPSDVRSFHGMCSYNRKFIRDFAKIAKPLTPLMGKPSDFVWTAEAQKAFETLRDALVKAPILVHYNPEANHEIRSDASAYAVGAVFYQIHPTDPDQTGVVSYFAKTLTSAQKNYSTTDRELLAAYLSIMEYKHFLWGKRFTLVTDHAPLSLLKSHKDPHHRLARWVAELGSFTFDVVYKAGSTHVDADCMSRLAPYQSADDDVVIRQPFEEIVRLMQHVSTQPDQAEVQPTEQQPNIVEEIAERSVDIRAEQRDDEYCSKFIDILESDSSDYEKDRRCRNFAILDGQLHRINSKGPPTLVVPARRRAAVLISLHDSPIGGHLGFSRTLGLIRDRFFWPKMRRDIKKYVTSCDKCQRRKASNVRRQGLTRPLPIAEEIFDTVGFDLITKLPKSNSGYSAILVCTDNLSKYAITVPLRDESADTIIHAFLNHVIAIHGCPRVVISDRGANLAGEQSRDFFRLYGIIRHLTTPYHPQANGQTERFNRTIAASLSMYVEKHQKDWPDYLQILTFAYNITDHSVTRVAPFELVFGRRPRLPIDNVLDRSEFIDPTRPAPGALSTEAVNLMKKYILENQAKNKKRLDARLAETTFKVGDQVLVERPTRVSGTANKLSFTYIGPYYITKKHNDLSFEIGFNVNRPINHVVHVRHLRKYTPREESFSDDIVDPTFIPRESLARPNEDVPVEETNEPIDDLANADAQSEIEAPPYSPFSPPVATLDLDEETLSADEC